MVRLSLECGRKFKRAFLLRKFNWERDQRLRQQQNLKKSSTQFIEMNDCPMGGFLEHIISCFRGPGTPSLGEEATSVPPRS